MTQDNSSGKVGMGVATARARTHRIFPCSGQPPTEVYNFNNAQAIIIYTLMILPIK